MGIKVLDSKPSLNPHTQVRKSGESPHRRPFAPPWSTRPNAKGSPQGGIGKSLVKFTLLPLHAGRFTNHAKCVVGDEAFLFNSLDGKSFTQRTMNIVLKDMAVRGIVDIHINKREIIEKIDNMSRLISITKSGFIILNLFAGDGGSTPTKGKLKLSTNGEVIISRLDMP